MTTNKLLSIHFRGWIEPDTMMEHRDEWFLSWYDMAKHFQDEGQKIIAFSVPKEMERDLVAEIERFLQSKITND